MKRAIETLRELERQLAFQQERTRNVLAESRQLLDAEARLAGAPEPSMPTTRSARRGQRKKPQGPRRP